MHRFIISALLLISLSLHAQTSDLPFYSHKMEVGKIVSNNESISGTRYFIGCDYYSHYFDENTNSILLLLRYRTNNTNEYTRSGHVAEFDLAKEKMLWSRKVTNFSWITGPGYCFVNSKNKVFSINRANGSDLWSRDGNIVFKNDSLQIIYTKAITVAPRSNSYSFENGKNKVTIITPNKNWHYDVSIYNDSLFLLTESKKISMISPNTGELWNYPIGETSTIIESKDYNPKMRITSNDIKRSLILTGVGTLLAAFTGGGYFLIMFYTTDNTVTLTQSCSNLLPENNLIYFASKDSLFCIKSNGNKKWANVIENQSTTRSIIFTTDENLIMLNLGYSFSGENIEPHGKPYVLITQKENGKTYHRIDLDNNSIISDYVLNGNLLYLIAANHIKCIDINLSQIVFDQVIDNNNSRFPFSILNSNNDLNILSNNNSIGNELKNCILIQGDSIIYQFDLNSNTITSKYKKEEILQHITEFNSSIFWESFDNIIISDKQNKVLAKLKKGSSYLFAGQFLYVFYETYLQKTDLNSLNQRLNELK